MSDAEPCIAPVRIVLSGPESSGKSTLAGQLATHFGMPMATEYSRFHLETGKPYPKNPEELTDLARQHLAWQRALVPTDAPCGIYDTDMLNFLVWSDVAFGRVPEEIDQWFAAEAHHVHLLCEPDLPWQPDPLREFPNFESRRMLFDRYREELERRGIRFFVIRGGGNTRFEMAVSAMQA